MFPGTQTAITSHFTPQKPPKNGTAPHPTIHNPIHSLWITLRSRPAAGARTKPNGRQEPRRRGRRLEGVRGCVLGLRGCVWSWCVWVSGVVCCRVLLPVRVLVCLGRMLCVVYVLCVLSVPFAMSVPFVWWVWFFALGRVSCSGVPVPPSGCAPVLPVVPVLFVCSPYGVPLVWCPRKYVLRAGWGVWGVWVVLVGFWWGWGLARGFSTWMPSCPQGCG